MDSAVEVADRDDVRVGARGRPEVVALIGFLDQGNLGMGYLSAVLRQQGCELAWIDVRGAADAIAAEVLELRPLVVGFSLIFQFFLPQYRKLAQRLREAGVTSHFTIGGHYPSLCPEELLANFPEIDSVVRYEGEETLVELVDRLAKGEEWREIDGVAYLRDGKVVATKARALVEDLDSLPFPTARRRLNASAVLRPCRCSRAAAASAAARSARSIPSTGPRPARSCACASPRRSSRKCWTFTAGWASGSFFFRMTTFPSGARKGDAGRTSLPGGCTTADWPTERSGRSVAAPNTSRRSCSGNCAKPASS